MPTMWSKLPTHRSRGTGSAADRRQSLRHQFLPQPTRGEGDRGGDPSIQRRKPLIPYDTVAYRDRNLIERMYARLKDFRRIATRYDKLARNFLARVLIAVIPRGAFK